MAELSELDVMKTINDQLQKIDDPSTKERILRWAWEKFVGTEQKNIPGLEAKAQIPAKGASAAQKSGKPKVPALAIAKDLNLKPQDKESFADFVKKKSPSSTYEQCLIAVYYLKRILELEPVTADHVFTCFKVIGWRVPADLRNTMQIAASVKGWLNTSDSTNLGTTVHGENHVEHDLPAKAKS